VPQSVTVLYPGISLTASPLGRREMTSLGSDFLYLAENLRSLGVRHIKHGSCRAHRPRYATSAWQLDLSGTHAEIL
jgi:hypothetical protein